MIITWYTDPSKGAFTEAGGKYSSYYQYDTTTKKFARIRLELGRGVSASGDTGKTGAFFKERRYVGFGDKAKVKTSQKEKWSVNEDGDLCFDGTPLQKTPEDNLRTFDTSSTVFNEDTFIHRGNAVTSDAHFPEGIDVKHLSLIANDTIINQKSIKLTESSASGKELSDALKERVSKIIDKPFADITDDDLLAKLKEQVSTIKEESIKSTKESLNDSLSEVDTLLEDIQSQITDNGLVPDEKFESAFKALGEQVSAAKTAASTGEGIQDAISKLSEAKTTLNEAAKDLSAKHFEALEEQMTNSDAAIKTALSDSQQWEEISAEYSEAESATSIEDYEKSIGNSEEVEAVELK